MVDTQKRRFRKYTQGLRSHLRCYLIGHQDRRFEDIVGMATAIEQDYQNSKKKGESHTLQSTTQVQQGNTKKGNSNNDQHRRKKQRVGEGNTNRTRVQTQHKKRDSCYNCRTLGHHSRKCRAPRQVTGRENRCFDYGKVGHIRRDCLERGRT